jgi:cytochrome oxidase Cu insertion factor (SCO1/SenC/PrrC family)
MTSGNSIWKGARRITTTASVAVWAIAVSMAAVAGGSGANGVEPAAVEAISAPNVLRPRGGLAWRGYFPNMELTTHNGDRVRFYDDLIKGKVVVINFMYTKCTNS